MRMHKFFMLSNGNAPELFNGTCEKLFFALALAMATSSQTERAAKLRKLQTLRQEVPFVTKSAFSKILDHVKSQGVPDFHTAKHMREANRLAINKACAYGPLHLEKEFLCTDGTMAKVGFLNLFSFMHFAFQAGGSFYQVMKDLEPPLGLIIYTDEIVVGNPLAHSPRKLWAVYLAFKQHGQLLQCEDAWGTLCLAKSSTVQNLDGNLSSLMREILLSILENPICEIKHSGILLTNPPFAPGHKRLQMRLSYVVQDGGAHKFFWAIKGDSGSRFCIKCANVFAGMNEEDVDPVSTYTKVADLQLASSQEILESWVRMEKRSTTLSQKEFKLWQQATGITWNANSIVARQSLRAHLQPQEQYVHDWMHCLLSNGLIGLALVYIFDLGGFWDGFANYIAFWSLPSQWASIKVDKLFDTKSCERHKKIWKVCVYCLRAAESCANCLPFFGQSMQGSIPSTISHFHGISPIGGIASSNLDRLGV